MTAKLTAAIAAALCAAGTAQAFDIKGIEVDAVTTSAALQSALGIEDCDTGPPGRTVYEQMHSPSIVSIASFTGTGECSSHHDSAWDHIPQATNIIVRLENWRVCWAARS